MTIRRKLLILLLGISLVPLLAYCLLDVSFSRIVRNRVQRTLRSALEERAESELIQTVANYDEKLRISAQAVRYGLRHCADHVQQTLWLIDIDQHQPNTPAYLVGPTAADLKAQASRYRFLDPSTNQLAAMDFATQAVIADQNESSAALLARLDQLTDTCRDIYAINPESKLWVYTILEDGFTSLYPSPGLWPYSGDNDPRNQPWYRNAARTKDFTPIPRVEPLTGKTVMTVPMPLSDRNGGFAGVVAMDIDLSAMLQMIEIAPEWRQGAFKFLIRPSANTDPNDYETVIRTAFTENSEQLIDHADPVTPTDSQTIAQIITASRQGEPGIIRKPFNAIDSLWAYGSSRPGGGLLILIVPHLRVVERADTAQQILFKDNIRAIQIATALIFTAIVAAVILAVMRARNITVPITNLAAAAARLAQGDFDVKVNIATNDELQQLGTVFNQVGEGLKEREKIKRSLELAQEIQQHFLPAETPELKNFQIAGICRYCDETGGDYYDFLDLGQNVGLVLGDVSGHGIGAAMLMVSTGSILRNNAAAHADNLSGALAELNRHLALNSDPGKFMTLFFASLNDATRNLSWASAGHEPAIWYKPKTGQFDELPATAMPLGVMEDAPFEQAGPVTLTPGDIVLIGTDGIWEAHNTDSEMYGRDRLLELIKQNIDTSAEHLASAVVQSVLNFCGDAPRTDDITLIVVKAT